MKKIGVYHDSPSDERWLGQPELAEQRNNHLSDGLLDTRRSAERYINERAPDNDRCSSSIADKGHRVIDMTGCGIFLPGTVEETGRRTVLTNDQVVSIFQARPTLEPTGDQAAMELSAIAHPRPSVRCNRGQAVALARHFQACRLLEQCSDKHALAVLQLQYGCGTYCSRCWFTRFTRKLADYGANAD